MLDKILLTLETHKTAMISADDTSPNMSPRLPPVPVVMPAANGIIWIGTDGSIETINAETAAQYLDRQPALFCHRHWTARRCGLEPFGLGGIEGIDALELFAFTRPGQFCLPTAKGLARVLGFDTRGDDEDIALLIPQACRHLLTELSNLTDKGKDTAGGIAAMMAQGGWGWAPSVMAALGKDMPPEAPPDPRGAAIWHRLKDNPHLEPSIEPQNITISTQDTEDRLQTMLGQNAEMRPGQKAYATSLLAAFNHSNHDDDTSAVVMAEAGTGTGKTLGYLAPSTLWAEENNAPVWISTFTRNLQHQVTQEMSRFYPEREVLDAKVVVRKGRENYLCLLNLEDALSSVAATPRLAAGLGLMARWAEANPEGDLTGSRFPAWLTDLLGRGVTMGLADRRGECIHSACRHFSKCFVEKSRLRARRADIVVANHALVMINAALAELSPIKESTKDNVADGAGDNSGMPTRYVFDEGHHLFDAADSAFSTTFSGAEAGDLRRWIRGSEQPQSSRGNSRARGLKKRLEDVLSADDISRIDMDEAIEAARILPKAGWRQRLSEASPDGLVETFLFHTRNSIYHRTTTPDSPYNLEISLYPREDSLGELASELAAGLKNIAEPLERLAQVLVKMLSEADGGESTGRLDSIARNLMRRANGTLMAWHELLLDLADPPTPKGREGFVDWMEIIRHNGQDRDIALHRHHLDPSEVFARIVLAPAHGAVITSATLTDHTSRDSDTPLESDWVFAQHMAGTVHLPKPAALSSVASPFDYASQTRILVVSDVARDDPKQTAHAMAELMQASGGGALGLFTAINRLKAVHKPLAQSLDEVRIPLYAQHVDAMNLQTLLQIFREDPKSCLLGTDGVRDGIDVPGQALQLIIFDRVPWPRQNLLLKARAEHYGRAQWIDRATRMKLRQAFGRLVRQGDDRGVFVMLDSGLPSRMLSAFPSGVEVMRCSLAEATATTRDFLNQD